MWVKQGKVFSKTVVGDNYEDLPSGHYILMTSMAGFYLQKVESFEKKNNYFGSIETRAKKIINKYNKSSESVGVMLSGLKGNGKSLLAELVAIETDLPVIEISSAYSGPHFETFIHEISQKCIIYFDEIEKLYVEKDQKSLLSLMGNTLGIPKLFIMTCNNTQELNDAFFNRPGRIFYHMKHGSLTIEECEPIVDELLIDVKFREGVINCLDLLDQRSYDNVKSLVEEVNDQEIEAKYLMDDINIELTNNRWIVETYDENLKDAYLSVSSASDLRKPPTHNNKFLTTSEIDNPFLSGEFSTNVANPTTDYYCPRDDEDTTGLKKDKDDDIVYNTVSSSWNTFNLKDALSITTLPDKSVEMVFESPYCEGKKVVFKMKKKEKFKYRPFVF